ncbi:uncharacterized protein LAESUDRAFT_644403 [Laetiporus sulphureus 93-53]|uniref:Uncharacterized protein n=1 Tax=Laetiporus sulphureus 93-53 TaxID=1314785 RepID=A0A165GEJ4_9APHY|nr:uncharacterized protein LAESUDRAFT_644403 [Laetiporus sulphureus 93-53]KZT10240.1 hypothetical protein LAESUDRAFT_644403 [Laetiporus sulphureus 93-53]
MIAGLISILDSEIILAIYGRAGYQYFYKQKLINSIDFIIFDQQNASWRVLGVRTCNERAWILH